MIRYCKCKKQQPYNDGDKYCPKCGTKYRCRDRKVLYVNVVMEGSDPNIDSELISLKSLKRALEEL